MLLEVVHTQCDRKIFSSEMALEPHFPSIMSHALYPSPSLSISRLSPNHINFLSLKKPPDTPTSEKWRVEVSVTQFRNLHFWNPLPITWHQLLYRPLAGPLDALLPASPAPPAHMATEMLSQHSAHHPEWKRLHALTRPWGFTWSGLGPFLCLTLHCSPAFCPATLAFSQSPHSGSVINNFYTHGPLPVMLIFFSITWIHPSDHKPVSLPLRRILFWPHLAQISQLIMNKYWRLLWWSSGLNSTLLI